MAELDVVLPTPPFPPTKMNLMSGSERSESRDMMRKYQQCDDLLIVEVVTKYNRLVDGWT